MIESVHVKWVTLWRSLFKTCLGELSCAWRQHVTHNFHPHSSEHHFDTFWLADHTTHWKVLELVSEFDIQDTLPTPQHDFCNLWNEIVHLARNSPDSRFLSVSIAILKNVHNAYITLHQDTNSAPTAFSSSTADDDHVLILSSSYPLCNISGHHLHPATQTIRPPITSRTLSFPIPLPGCSCSLLAYDLAPSPAPPNIIVSSSSAPQITWINVDQCPGIVTPSDSTPTGSAANTTIVVSTQNSVLVPQLTLTATTTSASPPTQASPSGTAPPFYVNITTVPQSIIPDTPPAFPIPVLNNTLKPHQQNDTFLNFCLFK